MCPVRWKYMELHALRCVPQTAIQIAITQPVSPFHTSDWHSCAAAEAEHAGKVDAACVEAQPGMVCCA